MKIVHICFTGYYTDYFSYQENLIAIYHKRQGFKTDILTSVSYINSNGVCSEYDKSDCYCDNNGINVTRLCYKKPGFVYRTLRRFKGISNALESENPDIMFIHGCQFLDMSAVVKYLKKHPGIRVFVDNHADFNNSATNFLSKNILHKIIWKHCAAIIEPYTEKFYGVVPARVDFLKEAYGLPAEKCELLVMGADDDEVQRALRPGVRIDRRAEYGVSDDDFVIVTGGKIDHNKPQVITLMKAVNDIPDDKLKLFVFGSVTDELKESFEGQLSGRVKHIGWRSSSEIYDDFAAADLAAFPGLHSVLWEQASGMGKPCLFKRIKGFEHVDLGGNCLFFENDSEQEYIRVIKAATENIDNMKASAEEKGMEVFSYKKIAGRAVK